MNLDGAAADDAREDGDRVVRAHLTVAAVFLVLAVSAASIAAIQLIAPGVGAGVPPLSYGRVAAMATNLLLYGWLVPGFLAGAYFVLPRVSEREFVGKGLATVSLVVIGVAVVSGTLGIAFGLGDGRPYLAAPIFAEGLLLVGLMLSVVVVARNVSMDSGGLVPTQWYLLASTVWAVFVVAVGLIPGLGGFAGAMQIGFYRAAIAGFWFAASGIGLLYYLVPRLAGLSTFKGSALSRLGFWSLAFVWGATGPVIYVYGPIPGWLQSLGIAFSIALFIPVLLIVADLAFAMRGRSSAVVDRTTLSFLSVGTFLFLLVPIHNLAQAMRTPSSVVGLTEWIPAGDFLLFAGAFSFWLFGFASHVTGNGTERRGDATLHLGLSTIGLVLAVAAMWMAGLATGLSWAAGVNAGALTSFGEGWSVIDETLSPFLVVRALGVVLFAIAQIVFVYTILVASWSEPEAAQDIDDEAFDLQLRSESGSMSGGRLRLGIVATFAIALLLTVVVPAFDTAVTEATILANTARTYPNGSAAAAGRAVYLRENCVACHTQSVRPIVTDVGLGAVSVAGDYVYETPPLIGLERLGPDLMHVGSRLEDVAAIQDHLDFPRQERPWSIMPSYRYLTQGDLDALTEYLLSLR